MEKQKNVYYLYEPPTVTIAGCWNWTACSLGCSSPGVQQVSVQNCVGPCSIPAATSSVGSPSRSSPPAHQSIEPLTDAHSTPGHTVSSPENSTWQTIFYYWTQNTALLYLYNTYEYKYALIHCTYIINSCRNTGRSTVYAILTILQSEGMGS